MNLNTDEIEDPIININVAGVLWSLDNHHILGKHWSA